MHNLSTPDYEAGYLSGRTGEPCVIRSTWTYQQKIDYIAGWEAGEAEYTATYEGMTEMERRVTYGDAKDQV